MNVECGAQCTVTVQLEPAPASPEHVSDLTEALGYMFLALILIWCAKQLYRVFDGGPHDGS